MALFDLSKTDPIDLKAKVEALGICENVKSETVLAGNVERKIQTIIGHPEEGKLISFWSNGDWSLWELIFYLLQFTGSGTEIYLATWSISELSARKLNQWMLEGYISKLVGVVDFRTKNRHPAAFYLSKNTFSDIKLANCHAKVTVLKGKDYFITINGSANWTENPRLESGTVFNSEKTANQNIELIKQIVKRGEYKLEAY
jgi:hypothetical protein